MTDAKIDETQRPFDQMEDGDVVDRSRPSVRPRDAATLILVRRDGPKPRVLVGQRSGRHDFMPDKYVFPGGRVDPGDSRAFSVSELREEVEANLLINARRKPRAFGLTAIRETFEETGLIIGQSADMRPRGPKNWHPFVEQGALPCLTNLELIGRAVTPPYRPKRFDARFFMADAETALLDERPASTSVELIDIRWVDFDEAEDMDLPSVTLHMVREARQRIEHPGKPVRPAYLRYISKGQLIDRL